jgi:hypothetical protein
MKTNSSSNLKGLSNIDGKIKKTDSWRPPGQAAANPRVARAVPGLAHSALAGPGLAHVAIPG